MITRLVNFLCGVVWCAVWFGVCWPVGYGIGFIYEKPHVPIVFMIFLVTLALAALRTHYTRMGDGAEGFLAYLFATERHRNRSGRGYHYHVALWGPLLHIALIVLTGIPALGVGLIYAAIAPDEES